METDDPGAPTHAAQHARRVNMICLTVLIGTTLSIIWHYINGSYWELAYPMDSFLFIPSDRFMDLLNTIRDVRLFDAVRGGVTLAYTPLQHVVLYVLIRLTRILGIAPALLWIVLGAFAGMFLYFLSRFFRVRGESGVGNARNYFILGALSYPVLWVLDRANTEMLVFAAVFGFVFFYYIRPKRWLWIACLAVAICLKIYPGVLVLIPLSDRRFRDSMFALLGAVAGTLGAAWLLGMQTQYGFSGVLQLWVTYLFQGHGGERAIWWGGIQHGHSIWGVAYLLDVLAGKPFEMEVLRKAYLVFAAVAALGGAAWTYFGHLRPWQKLTVVTFMYMLLPFSSHDYTLLHVYFPLALFVCTEETVRFDRTLTVLFALLLTPLDYYYFIQHRALWPAELGLDAGWLMGVSVLVYPAIMIAILALAARQQRAGMAIAAADPVLVQRPHPRPHSHGAVQRQSNSHSRRHSAHNGR